VPLPTQPPRVPWPGGRWPEGRPPPGVELGPLLDEAFGAPELQETYAVVVVHRGRVVAERYGGALPHFDGPPEPVVEETRLLSWSMAKSMLHAVVGMLVAEERLDPGAPATVPEWRAEGDPRGRVTLEELLEMRDGLAFTEDYVDDTVSDVIEMLFGSGKDDVARFAADRPLAAPPGTRFNYSSGTSNIVSGVVAGVVGHGGPYDAFLSARLFSPLGMASARPTFDAAGTWVASSFVHATARDLARFGLLYLRDGTWDGRRLLPAGWVDHGRRPRSLDVDGTYHGAHWWTGDDGRGTFWASGYRGQRVVLVPAHDLIVVRLGDTPTEHGARLRAWCAGVVAAFDPPGGQRPS